MSEYQLELKQIVDYPRCRIYRQFIKMLMQDENIRTGGSSGLYYFTVLSCYANFRTSYKRIDGISYGTSPYAYLVNYRVKKAKECLLMNMMVAETATLCGFGNINNFNRIFKLLPG